MDSSFYARDNYSDVRKAAADALEKIDPQWRQSKAAHSAIPNLVKALVNSDSDVRKIAATEALGEIGPTAVKAVPHLLNALRNIHNNSYVREAAAKALGKIGPAAVKAVPYLVNALGNRKICETAAEALGKIGPAAIKAVPHLVKALVDNNDYPDICGAIKESLDKIDPTGEWRKQQYS